MKFSIPWLPALLLGLALATGGGPAGARESAPEFGPQPGPQPELAAALFQDDMVLQRDAPIRIWGDTEPGDTVTVELAGRRTVVAADAEGRWHAELGALTAGGPHDVTITAAGGGSSERRQTLENVLVGDVFLCSGQSNMEMPVVRALDSWSEVNSASNDRIRMTKIGRASTAAPRTSYPAPLDWQSATPETVGDWSAVCYYFARELQKVVDVPLGLIDASWGGSDVRAWMDAAALAEVGGYDETLELLGLYAEDEPAAQRRFAELWESWWLSLDAASAADTAAQSDTAPWRPDTGANWPRAPHRLGNWKSWGVPELESFDGMVWYRATVDLDGDLDGDLDVNLDAEQAGVLVLGGVDEVDQTWINGHALGNTFGWGTVRRYDVPTRWLRPGENVVVTNVYSAWDYGGLVGETPRELRVGDAAAPLVDWRYRRVDASRDPELRQPPRAPWESIAGRTTLHNAMIAPLRDLALTGVLWYQGESNTAEGLGYAPLLESMIGGWRRQFGDGLPFLVVQLAGFGARASEPTESGLADVREAQRRVARDDPRVALATAVDVGDVYDVHPPNKQEVGRRLARAARHLIYGQDVTPSGPLPSAAERRGGAVRVDFVDVDGGLVALGYDRPIGFELCTAEDDGCRYAEASIEGDAVRLTGVEQAVRVRYCWADSPICTLYDGAGLPAIPFELDVSE